MASSREPMHKLKMILDKITDARAKVISATKSPWWARPRFMTHVVGPLIALVVIADTFIHTHKLNLFSLHPICMAIAFTVLMPEGVVAYRNSLLFDSLSPIMSHGTKAKKRTIHMTLQVLAAVFATLGLAFVAVNKVYQGKSILPRTTHGVAGIVTLSAMVVQVAVGRLKHLSFTTGVVDAKNRGKKYRWHGKMGLLLYDMATATFMLGLFVSFGLSFTTAAVVALAAYGWLNVNLQVHETRHNAVPVYASGGDTENVDGNAAADTQPLKEEGVPETKGEREYSL